MPTIQFFFPKNVFIRSVQIIIFFFTQNTLAFALSFYEIKCACVHKDNLENLEFTQELIQ
jgi:hypothetical protein